MSQGRPKVAHFACVSTPRPALERLLQVDCHIGLQPDALGRTALHIALEQGKYASLRVMLNALLRRCFTVVPGTMQLVSGCFATLASKHLSMVITTAIAAYLGSQRHSSPPAMAAA